MFKFINKIKWSEVLPGSFVTLTYPDAFSERTHEERTQDRALWFRHAEKYVGREFGALWRVEWQARKSGRLKGLLMPHMHLMLFNVPFIPAKDIRHWWRSILHHQGNICTDVQAITDARKAGIYLAKYVSKKDADCSLDIPAYLDSRGRTYGYRRPDLIPMEAPEEFADLTADEIEWLMEKANNALPWINKEHRGSWFLLGDKAKGIFEELKKRRLTPD